MPFDPHHITTANSLNRVQLVDLPGLEIDPEVRNRSGYELISARALTGLIQQHAAALEVQPDDPPDHLHRVLDGALSSFHGPLRQTAEGIARRLGRNLGYLLLTLRRGDGVNRAARPEWDDSYWAHWASIRRVWLGGGLAGGYLGPHLRRNSLAVLEKAGVDDMQVKVSAYSSALPLLGLARSAPPSTRQALTLDFGGTMLKRARAGYSDGTLSTLQRLASQPTHLDTIISPNMDEEDLGRTVRERMLALMVAAWEEASLAPGDPVLASVAAYMVDGQPLLSQRGAYMHLAHLSPNAAADLAQRLGERLGHPVTLQLLHDGTAAATTYAGEEKAAVIMIGTALGIGFPPPAAGLRPLASDFMPGQT